MTSKVTSAEPVQPLELHFTRTNGPADTAIDELIHLVGGIHHADLVREMILAALKAGQEDGNRADLKLMNSTLKEMRFTSKIFSPYRDVRKVTVFGSARSLHEDPAYQLARRFGRQLAEAGFMVITGGGPGIMQAVNEGAGKENSFGVNIRLPFEQKPNPIIVGNPRNITYKYFFNRKVAFIKEADAVALFPGGFGTHDEAMETLTLVQTGKRTPIPLILIDEPGGTYWGRWRNFIERELVSSGYIDDTDLHLFDQVDDISEALAIIQQFYKRYHSLRYVGEKLVVRMKAEIPAGFLRSLNLQFSDILSPGGRIIQTVSFPEIHDEPDVAGFPKLVVDFNRKSFGRLRHLIDTINEG